MMVKVCGACGCEASDGARFCEQCGAPLARSCPSCGAAASARGKFCGECGTALAERQPAPSEPAVVAPVSERRTTSVLFADLVAFTTWSEQQDPEEVRELLSSYFAVARTVVARYGGTVEKFIGDAVMAVWGVPITHEDDAERAVRAGLDLLAEVVALGQQVGAPDLNMRVGVVTGSVAVTLGAVNEGMVAGVAVNTAARVQSVADPGTVWTDTQTRSLTSAAIAYSDAGAHLLKGKAEPVQLFRAESVVAGIGGGQRVDGLEAPLVGRAGELRRIKETFHAGDTDGRSRLLLVEGPAGFGKSRMAWEFEKYVDGLSETVWWHRGRCLSYGEGVAFWAFAEMIRSRAGVMEGDGDQQVRDKVMVSVREVARDESEVAWLAPRLLALVSSDITVAGFDRTDLFLAWSTFLDRVGRSGPVVLVFEDMQHSDSSLLDFVLYLLENCRARLYLLLLARPELRESHPTVVSGSRTSLLGLDAMTDETTTELVNALVADLPASVCKALVARSEGVPLFAVETVRSLIDQDAVIPLEGRYVFVDHDGTRVDYGALATPTSVQMLITARLDALPANERRAVQDASVFGLTFWPEGLAALTGVAAFHLQTALDELVRKGVIEPQRDSRSTDVGSYRFLQALVREVAYGTLARRDRKARHLAAAGYVANGGDVPEALAGIVGQHLLDALDAAGSKDDDRSDIATRAMTMLVTAASRAEALGSPQEALRACMSALALEPTPVDEASLLERAGRVAVSAGDYARAEALGQRAELLYIGLGDDLSVVRAQTIRGKALTRMGRSEDSVQLLRPVFEALRHQRDVDVELCDVASAFNEASRGTGDARQFDIASAHVAAAERVGDPSGLVEALNRMAVVLIDAGSTTASTALMTRCVELASEHRLIRQRGRCMSNLLSALYPQDLQRARKVAPEALAACEVAGDAFVTELAVTNAGYTWWLSGDWSLARETADSWLADHGTNPTASAVAMLRAWIASETGEEIPGHDLPDTDSPYDQLCVILTNAVTEHDRDQAATARDAYDSLRTTFTQGSVLDDFEVFWAPVVEMQLAAGDVAAAESLLVTSPDLHPQVRGMLHRAQRARLTGLVKMATGEDPSDDLRSAERDFEAFGAPFYLARTRLELGRWQIETNRSGDASSLLAQAREEFERLGAGPSLDELDSVQPSVLTRQ